MNKYIFFFKKHLSQNSKNFIALTLIYIQHLYYKNCRCKIIALLKFKFLRNKEFFYASLSQKLKKNSENQVEIGKHFLQKYSMCAITVFVEIKKHEFRLRNKIRYALKRYNLH